VETESEDELEIKEKVNKNISFLGYSCLRNLFKLNSLLLDLQQYQHNLIIEYISNNLF
jgi:hypothetical protein